MVSLLYWLGRDGWLESVRLVAGYGGVDRFQDHSAGMVNLVSHIETEAWMPGHLFSWANDHWIKH